MQRQHILRAVYEFLSGKLPQTGHCEGGAAGSNSSGSLLPARTPAAAATSGISGVAAAQEATMTFPILKD